MRQQALALVILAALGAAAPAPAIAGKHPEPSIYPIAWQFDFKHGEPKRIVVGSDPYWYLTYTVTNKTGEERLWAPTFEMLTNDGKIVKAGHGVPGDVFDRVAEREHNRFLVPANRAVGILHQGEDQAKDSVAIWKEPNPRMGNFKIFVGGLSGEAVEMKDDDGKVMKEDGRPIFLRKTLVLNYAIYGDEFFPTRHELHDLGESWVMR